MKALFWFYFDLARCDDRACMHVAEFYRSQCGVHW